MKYRAFTVAETLQALTVELIRRLWGQGKLVGPGWEWVRRIHDNWIGIWIDWKSQAAMIKVDQQAKDLTPPPEVIKPVYWGEEESEASLGGPIGFTYKFDDAPSGADPLQGPEQR